MNNVMLGKKELVVIVVVLVLCCIYFIIEYFLNRNTDKKPPNKILENFSNGDETTAASQNINNHKLDAIKAINKFIKYTFKKFISDIMSPLYKHKTKLVNLGNKKYTSRS